MRLAGSTLVGLVLATVLAAATVAAIKVTASTSKLRLTTPTLFLPGTSTRVYRDYDIVVEPYKDAIRTGYRVRPAGGQTTGTITTDDGDCFRNPLVNDVICSKFSNSIEIDLTNSGDDDRVAIRENQRESELPTPSPSNPVAGGLSCLAGRTSTGGSIEVAAVVRLGGGDDSFRVITHNGTVCADQQFIGRPFGMQVTELEIYGGSGNDNVVGFFQGDTIDGGTGNDTVDLGDGNDRGMGGPGNDTVNGGRGNDIIRGDQGNDTLSGSFGNDVAEGGSGNDTISGDAGDDQLRGGAGSDAITAGEGNDVIWTDDDATPVPTPDEVNCGPGRDTVYADPVDNVIGCEVVFRHAYADGLPAYVTGGSVTIPANGNTQFEVRCPSQAAVRCTGTLTVRAAGASAILVKQSYDLAVGRMMTFILPLPGPRPATVVATTSEQGQTQARSATITLPAVF